MKEQFNNQNYITIETFRKSGIGVRTPVWFAKDENAFYVWTEANSGKAKRIRRDGAVKIAPSTARGEPVGEWVGAQATADSSPEALAHNIKLMKKKYGLAFLGFRLMGKLRKANYTAIKIELGN
ncbi:MAG: PPOX class F420-dependent oxidoreductase [Anaerolineales bacterium]|uniref:PPOX class F420-dependent oxidoreductase n=1 Tax=Candidatus Desulfolinea nitratireducens TaxID=2841698 RepID=A0A8J6TJC8_9CHLR|nr:PPOX class F420-dependent oxidoreductase [Candidatus Desulfolinea nitratireducens]